jgi:chromosome partitioning protein
MSVLAIVNQKGGVGKTTTAVTLAHGFALRGKRVLLIDLDSQGNVADCLGLPEGGDLYDLLSPRNETDPELLIQNVAVDSGRPALDVIRSDKTTATLKQMLAGDDFKVYRLQDALEYSTYDLVILDCAPSVDLLQTAAIVAAYYVLVPTRLDQLAMKGVRDVLKSMKTVEGRIRREIRLAGILPTFYDRVTSESYLQLKHLAKAFGPQVLPPIPTDTQCRVASRHGKTLWEFAQNSRALRGYVHEDGERIGGYKEVLGRIQGIAVGGTGL